MARWKYVRLGDECLVERGGSPRPIENYITTDESGINWIKIGDTTDSMFITSTAQKIIPEGQKKSRNVFKGDFLLSNSMSFGRPYILKIDGCIHDGWLVIRDEKELFDKHFLYYFLSAPKTYEHLKSLAVGGVVNNLNTGMVKNLLIPLPTIQEQREIASKFDKLERLSALRKQQLSKLDQLVKARFVEMFGDPVRNEKRWPKDILKKHASVLVGYPFPSESYSEKGLRIIGGYNIMQGEIALSDSKFWPTEKGFESYLLRKKDIVMAMDRPWVSEGFKIAMLTEENPNSILIQRTACIRGSDLLQEFLYMLLNSEWFAGHCNITGSLVPHISNKDINSYEVIIPPLPLQEEFAVFVQKVSKTKTAMKQSLEKLETLKKSLMKEYFG